jgi:O-methyltransferase domain/Dimerisation domain
MVGRIGLRPLLRLLTGTRKDKRWAELKYLLKNHLFTGQTAAKSQDPLPPLLFQMASGYWLSQALYVAAKLEIADLLKDGAKSSAELATATCSEPSALFRVLRALSSAGVLSQINKERFALARLGQALRSDVPGSLRNIVITLGEIHYQACGELLHAVRTGSPAFNRVFGASLFEYLQRNPQAGHAFNQGMTDLSYLLARAVLLAYDFSQIASIVDVGGGEGELLRSILELYPEMIGTVFDLPNELCSTRCNANGSGRYSYVPGNFFDSVPENAEAYLLCGVLHDWSDELAGGILRNCRKAAAKNGRLLIVETVVPETNSASFSKLLDINMMTMTHGRERTKSEFQMLLRGADFRLNRIIPTLAPQSIIEAIPT